MTTKSKILVVLNALLIPCDLILGSTYVGSCLSASSYIQVGVGVVVFICMLGLAYYGGYNIYRLMRKGETNEAK